MEASSDQTTVSKRLRAGRCDAPGFISGISALLKSDFDQPESVQLTTICFKVMLDSFITRVVTKGSDNL